MSSPSHSIPPPAWGQCVDIPLDVLGTIRPIPSGYITDRVYVLRRSLRPSEFIWMLAPGETTQYTKVYDRGDPAVWLEPYFEEVRREMTHVLGVRGKTEVDGLLTYAEIRWNNTFWLLDIRVRERERRRGGGTVLLREVQARARRAKVRGITVETQVTNAPAIDFYRKNGFEVSGFNDHLYDNDDLERQDVGLFLFWETS